MKFFAYGHPNITGAHKNTFELTKDAEISKEGECIIGVNSDYDVNELIEFVKDKTRLVIKIKVGEIVEEVSCMVNPKFSDENEMVFRLGDYDSARTLGIRCDKAAKHLNRELIEKLKNGERAEVEIEKV